ncbi:ferredoxin--NADP reductase [Nocardioides sp.]|uniref:ferredoxin--NADP reductase n=1 Tax=Nocardioides sp. TaxID=35761 RepID=UPI00260D050E|nr:ferredoxin--NADP reductase [Nocardioides sp.]
MLTEHSFHLTVLDVVAETEDACTVVLDPGEHAEAFAYRAGQFLTVAVPSDQTGVAARCYSLSSSPHDNGPLAITVKRTEGGYASNWICDNVKPGQSLQVLPPGGVFTPASYDLDLLLFAGGSGVTPIISIARTALAEGTGRLVIFYANRNESSVIFARELAEMASLHPDRVLVVHWLESVQGLPSQAQLKAFAAQYADFSAFVCGPAPFMKATVDALRELEFPRERRHQEKFISLGGNPFGAAHDAPAEVAEEVAEASTDAAVTDDAAVAEAGAGTHVVVELDGDVYEYDDWDAGTTLLDYLEKKGVNSPYSCGEGECSACAFRLLEGEVTMLRNEILDKGDLEDGLRLGCQAVPASETVRLTYN